MTEQAAGRVAEIQARDIVESLAEVHYPNNPSGFFWHYKVLLMRVDGETTGDIGHSGVRHVFFSNFSGQVYWLSIDTFVCDEIIIQSAYDACVSCLELTLELTGSVLRSYIYPTDHSATSHWLSGDTNEV